MTNSVCKEVKDNVPFNQKMSMVDNSLVKNYLIAFGQEEHSP